MKHLKFLYTLVLCMMLAISFASCSNDDEPDDNQTNLSPEGQTWKGLTAEEHETVNGKPEVEVYDPYMVIWSFPTDKDFVLYTVENTFEPLYGTYTYDKKSQTLEIKFNTEDPSSNIRGTISYNRNGEVTFNYVYLDNDEFDGIESIDTYELVSKEDIPSIIAGWEDILKDKK